MELRLSSCCLAVPDVDEAVGFYRDVLGFTVRWDAVVEGRRRVSVGPPTQPDVAIVIEPAGTDRRLDFTTDDCAATFERVVAQGVEVMQEPITRPDGSRDCAFLDPAGNIVRFTQHRVS